MSFKKTSATRYLCANAHFNPVFCKQVIEQTIEEEYRAIAPCYGVDLPTVIKHCIVAERRRENRDKILAILFLVPAIASTFVGSSIFFVFFIIASCVVFSELWISRYKIVAKCLSRINFDPDNIKLRYSNTNLEKKLQQIAAEQESNIIIYGGYSPFVGSGSSIGGWSFVLNTNKGKEVMGEVFTPQKFQVTELYQYVDNAIKELNLKGLRVDDNLYVNGQEIRDDIRFLPNPFTRPCTEFQPSFIQEFVENPTKEIRHYKCIRVTDWRGELILSIFLRFAKIGETLFLEGSYFLLTPLREGYYAVDNIHSTPTLRQKMDLIWQSAILTILLWPFSIINVLSKFLNPFTKNRQVKAKRRLIIENPTFNYGAISSLRENASIPKYRRYFQRLDKEMYLKVIERRILDSLIEFFELKNIDTSDLKQRQTALLNNGMIISGGSVQAESLSVGQQAQSFVQKISSAVTNPTQGNNP